MRLIPAVEITRAPIGALALYSVSDPSSADSNAAFAASAVNAEAVVVTGDGPCLPEVDPAASVSMA